MLEVGCGEGAVLQAFLDPPTHADSFPPSSLLDSSGRIESIPPAPEKDLRLTRVVGLDIQREVLDQVVQFTAPSVDDKERWNELTLELYEGSLDVHNDSFEGVHAIIATEVIEHLFPVSSARLLTSPFLRKSLLTTKRSESRLTDSLYEQATFKKAAESLLAYKPDMFVVTTPNHEFNSWFIDEEAGHLFPDPTGRTNRIFRDEDHKFEFTRAEFRDWVDSVLVEFDDYEVVMSGVGSLQNYYSGEPIPASPPSLAGHPALKDEASSKHGVDDPATFFATQIAVFTRKEGLVDSEERSPRCRRTSMLPFFSPSLSNAQEGSDAVFATASPTSAPSSPARPSASPATIDSRPLVPSPTRSVRVHSLVSRRVLPSIPLPPLQSIEETHRQIISSLKLILVGEFNESKISLARIWNCRSADGAALRLVCEGRISRVLECIIDAEAANEPWSFEVVTNDEFTAEDAVFIEWKEFVRISYEEIRNGETWREHDEVEEEEESDEEESEQARREPSIAQVTAAWGDEVSSGTPLVDGINGVEESNGGGALADVAESVW